MDDLAVAGHGRDSIRRLAGKLERAGYLKRRQVNLSFGIGTAWHWDVYVNGDAPTD
ncbi:hypothetical protein [Halosaccharopolyspora lacisalsi]|uniref:hypothetical protein n=1 Tax=Halosaccharopolyspora lacisalsi TaxID=1000566 RepID=UPI0015F7FC77|nr:hypothetical protein [Halosaccharopolyspora lacisalsi]